MVRVPSPHFTAIPFQSLEASRKGHLKVKEASHFPGPQGRSQAELLDQVGISLTGSQRSVGVRRGSREIGSESLLITYLVLWRMTQKQQKQYLPMCLGIQTRVNRIVA